MADGILVMSNFVDGALPRDRQAIPGFVSDDYDRVINEVVEIVEIKAPD